MKIFTKKSFVQKIVLSLVILISMTTIVPNYSYCAVWDDIGSALLKEIVQLIASLGDAVMGALNGIMLDTAGFGSAMLSVNNDNLKEGSGSWLSTAPDNAKISEVNIGTGEIDESGLFGSGSYQVPNMLYSPENIFANKIGVFDINFLNPNKYISAKNGNAVEYDENVDVKDQDQISGAAVLRSTIATWYRSFRNIAIVGLLSVLIYLGIRILISTTANDKAKYKENLKDWLVALCLVFFMHFIMAGIIMIAEKFTELFTSSTGIIQVNFGGVERSGKFYTNLMGLVRFRAQSTEWQEAAAYTIMYLALVIYTCIFTFIYFKRFLYTAFFTMISPLVALTYPIDKAGDKKAQAFSMWLKEYTMNVIIQPVHLLLYTALITSAMDLVSANPIYGLVAIAFLIPAEKFIKKMFGIESESSSGFASFAGGALAMKALDKLASGGSKKGSSGGGQKDSDGDGKDKVHFAKTGDAGKLNTLNNDTNEEGNNNNGMFANNDENIDVHNNGLRFGETSEFDEKNNRMLHDRDLLADIADNELEPEEVRMQADKQRMMLDKNIARNMNRNSRRDKAKRTISGVARNTKEGISNIAPYAKKAAKFTGKALTKGALATGGAMVGLAAGLTTGDLSKTWQYIGAGAIAGNAIGNKSISNIGGAANKSIDVKDRTQDYITKKTQGYEAMVQQQKNRENKRARKKLYEDKASRKNLEKLAGEVKYKGSMKDFSNIVADFYEAGVKDEDVIKNALDMERDNGGIGGVQHKTVVDVASFIRKYDKDILENSDKRDIYERDLAKQLPGNEKAQRKVRDMTAALYGKKGLYPK